MYKEIEGDLFDLTFKGNFDVIAQGCNCFCTQKKGISVKFVKYFGTNEHPYSLEHMSRKGIINKLGQVQAASFDQGSYHITVVNCYTQFEYGGDHPLDYEALILCLRKIAFKFPDKRIGLPQIGTGLAGGDWERIKAIIQQELANCDVTVVIYNKK